MQTLAFLCKTFIKSDQVGAGLIFSGEVSIRPYRYIRTDE